MERAGEQVVRIYGGVSKKGYAPYNPRKRNQDSMVMEEHKPTGSILFAVFDGHGEAGDLVSHYFAERVPPRLFASPKFVSDVGGALVDEIDRLEKMLLAGVCVQLSWLVDLFCVTSKPRLVNMQTRLSTRSSAARPRSSARCVVARSPSQMSVTRAAFSPAATPPASWRRWRSLTTTSPTERTRRSASWPGEDACSRWSESLRGVSWDIRPANTRRAPLRPSSCCCCCRYEDGIDGPARVWLGHMDIPGLAMSRSLGDTVAHTAGASMRWSNSTSSCRLRHSVYVLLSSPFCFRQA